MPAHVHLDPSATSALVVLEGAVRWSHLAGALLGLYGRDDSDPNLAVLWDAQRVTRLDVAPQHVQPLSALQERLAPSLDGGRSAFVVRRDIDGEIARLLTRTRPPCRREVGVFYRMEDGLAFLGQPSAPTLSGAFRSDRMLVVG